MRELPNFLKCMNFGEGNLGILPTDKKPHVDRTFSVIKKKNTFWSKKNLHFLLKTAWAIDVL